jgi:hypothetical protein
MRMASCLTMLVTVALIGAAPVCRGQARSEILPIDDKDLAKLDKEATKRRIEELQLENQSENGSENGSEAGNSQCGSVAIGNNDSNNQKAGLNSVIPSSTTVIVTGNVYNTANCGH